MTETEWTLDFAAPDTWLNANQRDHWTTEAGKVTSWRAAAHQYARHAKLPKGLDHIHITAHLHFTDNRHRDPHNYYPTLKAVIDGLVDYGLIADDTHTYLTGPDIRLGDPATGRVGRLTLTIRKEPPP